MTETPINDTNAIISLIDDAIADSLGPDWNSFQAAHHVMQWLADAGLQIVPNTRAVNSHHRLVEALEAFAFVGEDNPKDTQTVWEMIYRDRVQDWFSYEDFERARDLLAALKEVGRG